jgi:hypothetical protein
VEEVWGLLRGGEDAAIHFRIVMVMEWIVLGIGEGRCGSFVLIVEGGLKRQVG